jgi:N-acetylglucosamine-6-phosphate deacetylase
MVNFSHPYMMALSNLFTLTGNYLDSEGQFQFGSISIQDGIIQGVFPGKQNQPDISVLGLIVPGWLDIQINGGYGFDFTFRPESVTQVSHHLPETGVTGFLPTIITSEFNSYPARLDTLHRSIENQQAENSSSGARILGVHLEGPYLHPKRPGAHPVEHFRSISPEEVVAWADPRIVRLVTLAGELPGGFAAIRGLRRNGIVVSLGHSDADYLQAKECFLQGAGWATHLFNAMRPLHHREPGLIGELLENDIPCGMIVDGIHVHPALVKLTYRIKGKDKIVLVTDAMEALGMPPGQYSLSQKTVIVSAQDARLPDGTLAGSLLSMDQAVRNMVTFSGCSLSEALQMASLNPARLLGLDHVFGKILPGYHADLVILNEQIQPILTMIAGKIVFQSSTFKTENAENF